MGQPVTTEIQMDRHAMRPRHRSPKVLGREPRGRRETETWIGAPFRVKLAVYLVGHGGERGEEQREEEREREKQTN